MKKRFLGDCEKCVMLAMCPNQCTWNSNELQKRNIFVLFGSYSKFLWICKFLLVAMCFSPKIMIFHFFYVFDDMSLICYASQQIWATGLKKSSFLTQVFKKTFDGCYTDPRGPLFFCRFFFCFQCQKKQIPKKLVLKP